jgi:plastocyanin
VTIRYTDDGFKPDDVEVAPGTTVTFRNDSSRQLQVVPDPDKDERHPGFGQAQPIGPGETYSFTFQQRGEFEFINQLDPDDDGKVEVE